MNSLDGLFNRFKTLIVSSTDAKQSVVDCFLKMTGITLALEDVTIRDYIVHIKSHPTVKGEIYIQKHALLKELKNTPATRLVRDIR